MIKKSDDKGGYYDAQFSRISSDKEKIAKYAIEKYLVPGDSIVIDAGSSLYPIAKAISELSEENSNYSIMTHNYEAFNILKGRAKDSRLNLFLAGGRYDNDLKAFFGDLTCKAYESFGPRKVFIGVSGLSSGLGLRCRGNTEESQVKEIISKLQSRHRIIIADFTKFGNTDALQFANTSDLKVGMMERVEGYSPFKVRATIITNKPNDESYKAHEKWLIEQGTNKQIIPSLQDFLNIFESEIQNYLDFDIEVDIVNI